MEVTTKTIIKILPFEESLREELLQKIDSLPLAQKSNIEEMLWDTYYVFYELQLEENLQLAFENIKEGKENLDEGFYQRVEEKTRQDMVQEGVKEVEETGLEEARAAMEKIIKEMRAAKMTPRE